MRFIVGTTIDLDAQSAVRPGSLLFEVERGQVTAIGPVENTPDVIVQSFDPSNDIFYRSPDTLTPDELSEEVAIHFPQSLREKIDKRVISGSLGGLVLMQCVGSTIPAIAPLSALTEVIRTAGSVNYAILQADRAGLLFVKRSGVELQAYASARSLKDFLTMTTDERNHVFPDFHASEVLLSGNDLDHFENIDLGPPTTSRRISISDFQLICGFTPEATAVVELNQHLYSLVIGAAAVYAEIIIEANK
jgi:hypothetical protein